MRSSRKFVAWLAPFRIVDAVFGIWTAELETISWNRGFVANQHEGNCKLLHLGAEMPNQPIECLTHAAELASLHWCADQLFEANRSPKVPLPNPLLRLTHPTLTNTRARVPFRAFQDLEACPCGSGLHNNATTAPERPSRDPFLPIS